MTKKDKFWTYDLSVLYRDKKYLEFFPTNYMTKQEIGNAITRYSIYLFIIFFSFFSMNKFIILPVVIIGFVCFFNQIEKIDKREENLNKNEEKLKSIERFSNKKKKKKCVKPTKNNPYMNVLVSDYKNDVNRPEACDHAEEDIKEEVQENFYSDLYRNVGDLYGKRNSERQFYSMPVSKIVNNQKSFAEWLYKTDDDCKNNGQNCLKYSDKRYH